MTRKREEAPTMCRGCEISSGLVEEMTRKREEAPGLHGHGTLTTLGGV